MDRLRHGALPYLFARVWASCVLGFVPAFLIHGYVKQLHTVARRFLPELVAHGGLLSGAESVACMDNCGYVKQWAAVLPWVRLPRRSWEAA